METLISTVLLSFAFASSAVGVVFCVLGRSRSVRNWIVGGTTCLGISVPSYIVAAVVMPTVLSIAAGSVLGIISALACGVMIYEIAINSPQSQR